MGCSLPVWAVALFGDAPALLFGDLPPWWVVALASVVATWWLARRPAATWWLARRPAAQPPKTTTPGPADGQWCALGTAPPAAIERLFQAAENRFKVRLRSDAQTPNSPDTILDRCRALNAALDVDAYDPCASPARVRGASRARPFSSAAAAILEATRADLLAGCDVTFEGEAAADAGGVLRDFCSAAAAELAGPAGLLRPLRDGTLVLAPPAPPGAPESWLDDLEGAAAAALGDAPPLDALLGAYGALEGGDARDVGLQKRLEFGAAGPERLARVMAFGRLVGAVVAWSARSLASTTGDHGGAAPTLGVPLARSVAKLLTGEDVDASDARALDAQFYETRVACVLRPGGVDALRDALGVDGPLKFVWYDLRTGAAREPLHEGGEDEVVTAANADRYLRETAERVLLGAVRREAEAFVLGVDSVLGDRRRLLAADDALLLLAGLDEVDAADLRAHCAVVADGAAGDALAEAFFELVESYDGETRARLLLFATGYARLPPGGFARLAPRLTVTVDARGDPARLPTAHTCFNALTLPPYASRADLAAKLGVALAHGAHFGLR